VIVPVWTLCAAIAVPLGIERTDVWLVAFIVRLGPRELLEHLATSRRRPPIIQLILAPRKLQRDERQKNTRPTDSEERTHLSLLVLRIILAIDIACQGLIRDPQRRIAHLRREMILEVEETGLADVAGLGTGLADDCRFEAHAGTRVPAEDGEGTCAGSAFASEFLFRLVEWRRLAG
jgi:hypothetical protein